MLRLLIDENVDHRILRGLKSRLPELDFVTVRQVGFAGFEDSLLLRWAAQNDRTIITHDTKTMRPDAEQMLQRGETIAGLIVVPQTLRIGRAIEDLQLIIACHSQPEFRDRIEHLPL
ncbi:MAG TPA: DUF5615 family PIN-like protein [Pyrinomonadaceae bacterium]|jgi:hypothetical protein|nr:DUF5615 family PIN-like protein [Pyrinomonadaceae bacterium]